MLPWGCICSDVEFLLFCKRFSLSYLISLFFLSSLWPVPSEAFRIHAFHRLSGCSQPLSSHLYHSLFLFSASNLISSRCFIYSTALRLSCIASCSILTHSSLCSVPLHMLSFFCLVVSLLYIASSATHFKLCYQCDTVHRSSDRWNNPRALMSAM
jgi:hypothetical protein